MCAESATEISGSVMMECVYHTDGTVMVLVTARMALMRWPAVCTRYHLLLFSFMSSPSSPLSLLTFNCVHDSERARITHQFKFIPLACPPKAFECADGSGCVTESLACDGRAQCSDGSDELDCDWRSGCLSSDWKCRNNICIPQNFICNEVDDCGDNSDEETCGKLYIL